MKIISQILPGKKMSGVQKVGEFKAMTERQKNKSQSIIGNGLVPSLPKGNTIRNYKLEKIYTLQNKK